MLQILLASAIALVSASAQADDRRKHSKKFSRKVETRYTGDYADIGYYRWGAAYRPTTVIAMDERAIIQRHYAIYFSKGRCPPGLARHEGACTPPMQAKRFVIGQALTGAVANAPLPPELGARLVAPPGHAYFYLDGHVLLVAQPARLVVDAVAVGATPR